MALLGAVVPIDRVAAIDAVSHGSMRGTPLAQPVVGITATPSGAGYWLVARDGGLFAFGDAAFYGSMGATPLNLPVVAMAATGSGRGYWQVAADGGLFAFGDAGFYGSMGSQRLNRPVVGMAATPLGHGYWEVATDGGIFAFGDAGFYGSTGSMTLNQPIVGMAATPSGRGYWLVAADGGLFAYGDAEFHGSLGGVAISRPVIGMAAGADVTGYWLARADGSVDAFSPSSSAACEVFPADNPWNTDISGAAVHPNSDAYVSSIGAGGRLHADFGTVWNGAPNGIPTVEVPADQPRVPVSFEYDDESDPGPYPIPADAPIEGGAASTGDRHVLVLSRESCTLYELFDAHPVNGGTSWTAGSGAIFDLRSNALRPDGWTSADAAGLPIYPGLVRYDEVAAGEINHALRFTVSQTQAAWIHPATHEASSSTDPSRPPMGLRLRLKAGYDCSGASTEVQVICTALKRYGMLVADNGSNWYVSGSPDPRWDDDALRDLSSIPGSAFEAVDTGPLHVG